MAAVAFLTPIISLILRTRKRSLAAKAQGSSER
jgi:hypothetical protein